MKVIVGIYITIIFCCLVLALPSRVLFSKFLRCSILLLFAPFVNVISQCYCFVFLFLLPALPPFSFFLIWTVLLLSCTLCEWSWKWPFWMHWLQLKPTKEHNKVLYVYVLLSQSASPYNLFRIAESRLVTRIFLTRILTLRIIVFRKQYVPAIWQTAVALYMHNSFADIKHRREWWWWCGASCPRMSVDILRTNCDQCLYKHGSV